MEIPAKHEKSLRHVNWTGIADYILRYLDGKTKQTPRLVRIHGKEHFEKRDGALFVYGREVIVDVKKKFKILNREEENYGGQRKASDRINRKYFGISRSDVTNFFGASERRQLKARKQKVKKVESFVHATGPGTLQVDLTFYRGQNIPVFGAVDVFSRYAYYERVPNKRADFVVKAMKNCVAHFQKLLPEGTRIVKVSSDAGVEFQAEFKAYLKKEHIFYDKQVRSRKMIESLNRTLRRYVERVGWDKISELDELIAKFMVTYNQTKHNTTKKRPIDLVKLQGDKRKSEAKDQRREGKKRMGKSKGFNVAELKVGDKVRIYDPKRREIKAKQKADLKGKIKLSSQDYVKQYTSHHMGNDPHWTKTVYIVERIVKGNRAMRYQLVGKKGAFMRSELQKVTAVRKPDPRIRKKAAEKKAQEKLDKRKPPEVRAAKLNKFYLYFDGRRGLGLAVHRNFILVMARRKLLIKSKPDIERVTNDKVKDDDFKELLEQFKGPIEEASQNIDAYLDGKVSTLKQPERAPEKPKKPEKMVGRHLIIKWEGKILKDYVWVIEVYKGRYIVQFSSDNDITYIEEHEIHKKLDKFKSAFTIKDTKKINPDEIKHARKEIDEL